MREPALLGMAFLTGCLICVAIFRSALWLSDRWEAWRG